MFLVVRSVSASMQGVEMFLLHCKEWSSVASLFSSHLRNAATSTSRRAPLP